jgi:hypothetical protein
VSAYSRNERLIAQFLEQFPLLRSFLKYLYQRIVYIKNYKTFKIKIKDGWQLYDPFPEIKGHTFFGYYDKSPFCKNGNLLTHAVNNEICSIYVRIKEGELLYISKTDSWNWQQGAMATWINDDCVGFNKIEDEKLAFFIYSIEKRSITFKHNDPLQCYSLKKNIYASISYDKLNFLRPEYGYQKLKKTRFNKNYGIKIYNIFSNQCIHSISLDEVISFLGVNDNLDNSKLNHCQFSPNGKLILFMFRTFRKDGKYSFLLIWDYKNNKLIKLIDDRVVSHYSWINDNEIIVWGRINNQTGYHTISINKKSAQLYFKDELLLGDGHPTYCGKGEKMITDTYPDKSRFSSLFLLNLASNEEHKLAQLKQPWKFVAHNRVDLHPRFSPDCNMISIESGHSGFRRQYIISEDI